MVSPNLAADQELLFGKGSAIINDKRARTAQTPGGTGGLRVAADFLAKNTDTKRIWVSNPSWPNHKVYSIQPAWKFANIPITTPLTTNSTSTVFWPA